jgi:hypothetical protein
MNLFRILSALLTGAFMVTMTLPAAADAIADFYSGKQISLIIGYGTGGGYDLLCSPAHPLHRRPAGIRSMDCPRSCSQASDTFAHIVGSRKRPDGGLRVQGCVR